MINIIEALTAISYGTLVSAFLALVFIKSRRYLRSRSVRSDRLQDFIFDTECRLIDISNQLAHTEKKLNEVLKGKKKAKK